MSPSQPPQAQWTRLAGMGIEYGAVVVACTLLGYWVDYHWQIERHWGTLIGVLIGLIGGTYNFVREALQAVRKGQQRRSDRHADGRPAGERLPDEAADGSRDLDGNGRE
jgi:F0F1-type ATP synthase assembly protein I